MLDFFISVFADVPAPNGAMSSAIMATFREKVSFLPLFHWIFIYDFELFIGTEDDIIHAR